MNKRLTFTQKTIAKTGAVLLSAVAAFGCRKTEPTVMLYNLPSAVVTWDTCVQRELTKLC